MGSSLIDWFYTSFSVSHWTPAPRDRVVSEKWSVFNVSCGTGFCVDPEALSLSEVSQYTLLLLKLGFLLFLFVFLK